MLLNLKDAAIHDYLFRAFLGYFLEICKVIHDDFFVPIIGCFPGFALRDVFKHPVAVFQKEIFSIRPRRYVIFCLSHYLTSSLYCRLTVDLSPAFLNQKFRPQYGSNFHSSYFVQFSNDDCCFGPSFQLVLRALQDVRVVDGIDFPNQFFDLIFVFWILYPQIWDVGTHAFTAFYWLISAAFPLSTAARISPTFVPWH